MRKASPKGATVIASDLDGTVRKSLEPFASLRDESSLPLVRVISGIIASILARRINKHIDADVYITGSPSIEDTTTKIWLILHGMSTRLVSNQIRDRRYQRGDCGTSAPFKMRWLDKNKPSEYYDDDESVLNYWRDMSW